MTQEETVYYQDSQVRVTNARIVVGATTYALGQISSVSLKLKPANRTAGAIVMVAGIIIGSCVGMLAGQGNQMSVALLIGGVIVAVGLVAILTAKDKYTMVLVSSSGEMKALVHADKTYVQKVVDAVNTAIIGRG
ncbi:MAG: hypothetical protein KKA73_09035 [Chloroflexi bacterium]|nr:hypothetical protein [Chloroflexota bacterium]MBU1747822.1 hypothetical protein [Chloroflexota bacterium]